MKIQPTTVRNAEPAVAHAVAQLTLERTDRHEVLRRSRVDVRLAPDEREHRRGAIGDRRGFLASKPPRGFASHHAGPRVTALERREPQVPGVARVRRLRRDAEHRGPLARRELGDHAAAGRLQVGDAMGLHVPDRWVLADLLERAVGNDGALGGQRLGAFALGVAHLRVQRHHEEVRVVAGGARGGDAGLEVDGRHLLTAAPGQHGPALDANVGDLGAPRPPVPDDRAHGERAHESRGRPALGVVEREPGIDPSHAVDERDALDAVVDTLDRLPVVGLDGRVDRALGGGERVVVIERGAVVGIPALDEDARHAAYRTHAPRQLRGGDADRSSASN